MTEENASAKGAVDGTQADNGTGNEGDKAISNADAKALPWVQELAKEAKELRQWKAEQLAEKEKAEENAKVEAAKAKGDFDAALAEIKAASEKRIAETEAKASEAHKKALAAEIKAALLATGANVTPGFVKVALAEYDPEKHESAEALAEALSKDSSYAGFYVDGERKPKIPPVKTPTNNGTGALTNDQIRVLKASDKREDRAKATKYLADYFDEHGSLPPGYIT